MPPVDSGAPGSPRFPSTLWTTVIAAQDRGAGDYRERVDRLIRLYWKPVYWILRSRWRRPHHDAKDLTQAFFATLLEKNALAGLAPDKGRFRTWLRVVLDNFMRNELEAAAALKRGGGRKTISLDAEDDAPPIEDGAMTPEKSFDRAWAIHVFRSAVGDLRAKCHAEGRDAVFAWFERHELDPDPPSCANLAEESGRKVHEVENALKAARAEFGKLLRERVRETIADPERVEEELRALAEAMG